MGLKEKTISGVIWSGIDTFGQYLIQLIVTILLARLLTPADFGLIEMLVIFSSVSTILLDSGFGQALIRKNDATAIDYSSVFYFNIFFGFLLYALFYISAPYIASFYDIYELKDISRVYFLIIIINSFVIIQNTILSKNLNFKVLAKTSLISSVLSGVIGVFLALYGFGVWSLVFQLIAHSFLKAFLLWVFNKWRPILSFRYASISELFPFSSKLMLNGLLDTIVTNLQSLVIGKFYTKTDLGLYSQAKKFQSLPSQTLTQIIQKVTYPALSKIQNEEEKLKGAYRKIIQIATFIVFTAMLYFLSVADNLFYVVLSEKWVPAVQYFRPLCIIGILHPMQSINVNIFLVRGRSGLMLKLSLIRRIMVVLSLFVAIKFGVLALVWSLVFTYVVTGIIFIYFGGKLINYTILEQVRDVLPTLLIASILSLGTYLVGMYIIIDNSEFITLLLQTVFFFSLFIFLIHFIKIKPYLEIRFIISNLLKKVKK